MRVGDPYSIVARMEDCLTRELACFSGIRETLEAFIALLKTSGDDESALDGLSDKLSRSGLNTDDLAAEYTILKKEWDGVKSELDAADRGRMNGRAMCVNCRTVWSARWCCRRAASCSRVISCCWMVPRVWVSMRVVFARA